MLYSATAVTGRSRLIRTEAGVMDWLVAPRSTAEVLWYLNPHTLARHRAGGFAMGADDFVVADGGTMARLISRRTRLPCASLSFDYSGIGARALDHIARSARRVALIGGTAAEASRVAAFLAARHPGLNLVLVRAGYDTDIAATLAAVEAAAPDVLFLSMGSPRQERLAMAVKQRHARPMAIVTCGAFVHQTARHPYYPDHIMRLNLRWAYRALVTPHVGARILRYYLPFVARAALRAPQLPFRD